jgi:hypothetical protein
VLNFRAAKLQSKIGGSVANNLVVLEEALRSYLSLPTEQSREEARIAFGQAVDPSSKYKTISESFERALDRPVNLRSVALSTIRVLGVDGVLQFDGEDSGLQRIVVRVVEQGAPDFCKFFKIADCKQNYEKIARLSSIHADILGQIQILRTLGSGQHEFMGARRDVMHSLKRDIVQSYLAPYDLQTVYQEINATFVGLEALIENRSHEFPALLESARSQIAVIQKKYSSDSSFLAQEYVVKFFLTAEELCSALDVEARGKFQAVISSVRDGSQILEKRYPLHEEGRTIQVSIPLRNSGPGVAIDVTARTSVMSDFVATNDSLIRVGDIIPGEFVLLFEYLILEGVQDVDVIVDVEWGQVLSGERRKLSLPVQLKAQSSKVNWEELAQSEPYSLEVAEGEEFVGRQSKVLSIAGRLMRPRMVSTYITGQKRIGKSSLSLAVRDHVVSTSSQTHFLTMDRGDYAHEDPRVTLRMLGERISEFFLAYLPASSSERNLSFDGTLAPLNRLADELASSVPQDRFVIVLDEFDGIHPELYRMGALAETFFANLRTLSAKRNVAFILVGGENMPFIISAQGDELNKFSYESLTYFSRVNEWQDFCSLVQKPVSDQIEWYDSALNALFVWTNGHPFYTKSVCAEILRRAVDERDAEITAAEVQLGVVSAIGTLDTNSFAHLWKDGIGGTREEAEVVSLRRCRVLIAVGRALRDEVAITIEAVNARKGRSPVSEVEIANTMQDLCSRRILQEDGGIYQFTLPLFGEWLKQSGVNTIIPDLAADELAVELKEAEDRAYVKDGEILAIAMTWPPYQGREVTTQRIRSWLDQVESRAEQRLLFKLLSRVKFWSDIGIRESLSGAHRIMSRTLPPFVRKQKSDRRSDVVVTYVDGPGKSGAEYARKYVEDNQLASYCLLEMNGFSEALQEHEQKFDVNTHAVVIVDDIVGTGRSLSSNVQSFLQTNRAALTLRNPAIRVIAMCATQSGIQRVRDKLRGFHEFDIELIVSDPLAETHQAFPLNQDVWGSSEEAEEARALCRRIGSHISKSTPFGYGDQGLLVVFPQTCPNNSLPLLYATGKKDFNWTPLFNRPLN